MKSNREEILGEIINPSEEEMFSSQMVADRLSIAESTIRKYSGMLKNAGYVFQTDVSGNRIYRSTDIRAFAELIRLKKSGLGLSTGVKMVASMQDQNDDMPDMTPEVLESAKSDMQIRAFQEMQRKFLEQSNQMRDSILEELRKSLPDPALQKENEELKKELSETREALSKNTEVLTQLLLEREKAKKESSSSFWKGWFSKK